MIMSAEQFHLPSGLWCSAHHHRKTNRRSRTHCKTSEVLTVNFTRHRAFGVTSRSPAVLVTLATPSLSGARGTTSAGRPGGRRTGISSRDARPGRSGGAGRTGRAARLNAASGRGRGARASVFGDRAVGRGRRAALDGRTSGPTFVEQLTKFQATNSLVW